MTFQFNRYDPPTSCSQCDDFVATGDGDWVAAQDAINREAVNAAKIDALQTQLKEAKLQLHRVRGHLVRKNRALIDIRDTVNSAFDPNDPE